MSGMTETEAGKTAREETAVNLVEGKTRFDGRTGGTGKPKKGGTDSQTPEEG